MFWGGSVVNYVLVKEFDASTIKTFNINPLSSIWNKKLLYSHIVRKNSYINLLIRVQRETKYIMWPRYKKANLYVNEVVSYVMDFLISKDEKTNWQQLKGAILRAGVNF